MPKRKIHPGIRQRRSRAARQHQRNSASTWNPQTPNLLPDEKRLLDYAAMADPYAPQFGETVVLAVRMSCASCPTEIEEGSEATYIDGELNCSECTWEARHPRG